MKPWQTALHASSTLTFPSIPTTLLVAPTSAKSGIFSGRNSRNVPIHVLDVPEAATYFIVAIGGGGAGGAYAQNDLKYAPGGGGGGGGMLNVELKLDAGDVVTFTVALAVTVPGMDGEPTIVTVNRRAGGPVERYVAEGGKGGQTWDGEALVRPLGGLGGLGIHPTLDGQPGQNSFFVNFSAPPQGVAPLGGSTFMHPRGKGGNGGTSFEVNSATHGSLGVASYQIVGI